VAVDLPASGWETDGNGYAFAKLDILEWHTKQEPRVLGLPFFIHRKLCLEGFFMPRDEQASRASQNDPF
jgi:hypothetical protein